MAILELIHVTPAAIGRRAAVAFAFTARGHPRRSFRVAALHIRLRPMRVFPSSRSLRLAASRRRCAAAGLLWAARSALVTLDNSLVDRTGFHAWRRVSRGSALSTVDGRLSAYRGYYG